MTNTTRPQGGRPGPLNEKVAALERANHELQRLAALKEEFLEVINHQLRTPVTAIVECAELIRDGAIGPIATEHQPFVQTLAENATRLARLVEEVLDLSLLKSGRRRLERSPADLATLLARCSMTWQARLHDRVVRLTCGTLPPVYMDTTAIEEVMDHLLRNAARHAPPSGEILIQGRARDGEVEVSVHHGGGLPREHLHKLFEPFTHIQDTQAPGLHGSGLGLAFCRQVIERHRGTIRMESREEHGGTTVTFSLPLATPQFLVEEAWALTKEDAEYESGQFGVLLVVPASASDDVATLTRAEQCLRRATYRGDRFVRPDERTVAILGVSDRAGLEAMRARLCGVLRDARCAVRLGVAGYPEDGRTPSDVLEAARQRLQPVAE